MAEYGFKKVLSMDEYASYFDNIDPLAPFKMAHNCNITSNGSSPRYDVSSERVQAAFVVSDPVDWSRDIQVLCDILRTGGLPGKEIEHQPPLYFAADDLEYQAAFPSERLGMGAFRIALESIFNRIHPNALEYTHLLGNHILDVKGARQAGHPWFSVLTRTGIFRGKENHEKYPADLVFDTVEDAVNFTLDKEITSFHNM
ncbi:hypothetical protein MKX01_014004 [Papaver californicum]|nr:hypothetical protein MKX01_014004 [Papaver californicum]